MHRATLLGALFLLLFGARLSLIGYAGIRRLSWTNGTATRIFFIKPYLSGRLSIGDLFAPFNEHRIVFTRLLVLTILRLSGYWDVILQMIVNAVLESATVVAIAYALARPLPGGWALAAMIACVAINAVPYGYDNALFGFNTHFSLLITFSFAESVVARRQPRLVGEMDRRRARGDRSVPVYGLRSADSGRRRRDAGLAGRLRPERRRSRVGRYRRAPRIGRRAARHDSACGGIRRLQGA